MAYHHHLYIGQFRWLNGVEILPETSVICGFCVSSAMDRSGWVWISSGRIGASATVGPSPVNPTESWCEGLHASDDGVCSTILFSVKVSRASSVK